MPKQLLCYLWLTSIVQCFGQFQISPLSPVNLKYSLGVPISPPPPQSTADFGIYAPDGISYAFDHAEMSAGTPNFLVLTPRNGTGSTNGIIGLNPDIVGHMRPGTYSMSVVYTTTDAANPMSSSLWVTLLLAPNKNVPTIRSVYAAVSKQANLSPGAIVSILGSNLGNAGQQKFDGFGFYPTVADSTTVTFNGIRAALLKVTPEQIDALVPYEMAGQGSADVVVNTFLPHNSSEAYTVSITDTAPALFTADDSGSGQGLFNTPKGLNTPDNPVPKGSFISFRVAGLGRYLSTVKGLQAYPSLQLDGQVAVIVPDLLLQNPPLGVQPAFPINITIGGVNARFLVLQPIYYEVWDLVNVSVVVPEGLSAGPQPIVVRVGDYGNSAQNVTVSVQ